MKSIDGSENEGPADDSLGFGIRRGISYLFHRASDRAVVVSSDEGVASVMAIKSYCDIYAWSMVMEIADRKETGYEGHCNDIFDELEARSCQPGTLPLALSNVRGPVTFSKTYLQSSSRPAASYFANPKDLHRSISPLATTLSRTVASSSLQPMNMRAANLCRDLPPNGEAQISLLPFR
jgi:hypothetical protein